MGILICGLNGVGKSTIGRILAQRLTYAFIDNEELFFSKENAADPFSNPRSKEEAIRILEAKIAADNHFVFAAVRGDYGDKLIASLDYAVLVDAPKPVRMQRVWERSYQKFGGRMLDGGDLHEKENAWFSFVNDRPEDYVTKWLSNIACLVLRVDGTMPVEKNVADILTFLASRSCAKKQNGGKGHDVHNAL